MKLNAKQLSLIILIIIPLLFDAIHSFSCTIFSLSDSTQSLMGNSEDFTEEGYMTVVKKKTYEYGRITFSFADKYVQGGINEHGLAIDGTGAIKEMNMVVDPLLTDLPSTENIIEIILKKCKNTDDAVELCRTYNLLVLKYCHIMFTDASGKSAIVVLDKDGRTQYLMKDGNYKLLTNFNPLNPSVGYYPCERYDTAIVMLPQLTTKEWNAAKVLNAVRQAGGIETHYGQVYDCKNKKFHFFRNQDYTQAILFNVEELLNGNEYRKKLNKLPKFELYIHPKPNETLIANDYSISYKAEEGDYRLIMSKSEDFENPVIRNIISDEIDKASLGIFFLIFLILLIPKTKLKISSVALLIMLSLSCDKDSDTIQPVKNYEVQISANETGKWYWKIEGKTNSGHTISTEPMCVTIE